MVVLFLLLLFLTLVLGPCHRQRIEKQFHFHHHHRTVPKEMMLIVLLVLVVVVIVIVLLVLLVLLLLITLALKPRELHPVHEEFYFHDHRWIFSDGMIVLLVVVLLVVVVVMGIFLTPAERHRTDKDFHFHHYRRRALNVMLFLFVTQEGGWGHRILQERAGFCRKNQGILKEKMKNHWKMEAVWKQYSRPEIFGFLPVISGAFWIFGSEDGRKLPEKILNLPAGIVLP